MSRFELEGISMNWLHFPRNVDLVELQSIMNKPKFRKKGKSKHKVAEKVMAREVRRIIQEAMFGDDSR